MAGCILLVLLLLVAVLAPPIGIPLLLVTMVVMAILYAVRGSSAAVGALFSMPDRGTQRSTDPRAAPLVCDQCSHSIRPGEDYAVVADKVIHVRCPA